MKKEKIVLSFIATLIGLLAAGGAFYLYESSKTTSQQPPVKTISIVSPSPTPMPSIFLIIDTPKNEDVVNKKVVTLSGKTTPDAIVSVISEIHQDIVIPSGNGSFSTTINIADGQNLIHITALAPNGESVKNSTILTHSTEEF